MTIPKTIQAYPDAGLQWTSLNETPHDVAVEAKKQLIKNDKNQIIIVQSVTRLRVEEAAPSTEIKEWQHVIGKTGLGNTQTYYNLPEDLCYYKVPITNQIIRFNLETEQNETIMDDSDIKLKTVYEYEFNKHNIKMVADMTRNNRQCEFTVRDERTNFQRKVETFEEWSTRPIDDLLSMKMSKEMQEKQDAKRLGQQYH